MAAIANLAVVRGDTLVLTASVKQSDGVTAFNLTGCTMWFTVKDSRDTLADDTAAISKLYWVSGGAALGIAVATPATGVGTITMPAADSANLNPALTYVYDVQVKDASGLIFTVVQGTIAPSADTTVRVTTP